MSCRSAVCVALVVALNRDCYLVPTLGCGCLVWLQVMAKMLPRHMEIIEIINDGWCKWLETQVKVRGVSI